MDELGIWVGGRGEVLGSKGIFVAQIMPKTINVTFRSFTTVLFFADVNVDDKLQL